MRASDGTLTGDEAVALAVVRLAPAPGALLAGETRPERHQVASRAAKALARAGLVEIHHACATLTARGRELVEHE